MKNDKSDKNPSTGALGLDIGTSRVVLARRSDDDYQFQSQLNAFVSIPYSRLTEGVLQREKVPYSVMGGEIVVHGNESERFADLLGRETRRPMTRGVLNPGEPESEAQLHRILDRLLGEQSGKGQRLYFSTPAPQLGVEDNLTYHE